MKRPRVTGVKTMVKIDASEYNPEWMIDDAEDGNTGISGDAKNVRTIERIPVATLQQPKWSDHRSLQKAADQFEKTDNILIDAWAKQVCAESIEKAPDMWQQSDNVPQFIRTFVQDAALTPGVMYGEFNDIPHMAALRVHEIIKDELTSPTGWSIESITLELADEFEWLGKDRAEIIARTEVSAVLNRARKMAYDASGQDLQFFWSGPSDHRTTDICEEIKAEIDRRGGYVPVDELRDILRRKARKYKNDGGTPERVNEFVPHYQCRHTFVRSEFRWHDL